MKKLMFVALTFTTAIASGATATDGYSPSSIPGNPTEPDVMPGVVNYQGILRDPATSEPYADGIYTLECRLYRSMDSSAKAIWGGKYQVYVSRGYFNLMLGSAAADLDDKATFSYPNPQDLWKALWYNGNNKELYLGVKPWNDKDGAIIADASRRREITPRQRLVAAPFALRAQKAQYADAAPGNFNVAGDLKVTGRILDGNGSAFGLKNVTATDSALTLGKTTSSPAKTTLKGQTVTIESGAAMNVNPGGDATITMKSGKSMNFDSNNGLIRFGGAWKFWVDSPKVDIGEGSYGLSVNTDDSLKTVDLTGGRVQLMARSSTQGITASISAYAAGDIYGQGNLKWYNNSGSPIKPFKRQGISFDIAANQYGATKNLNTFFGGASDYKWSVVGYSISGNTLQYAYVEGSNLTVYVKDRKSSTQFVTVYLLGICNAWCD